MTVKRSAFAGEVEPWINGQMTASGAYFGQDARDIVHRLLSERLPDGGWNCEAPRIERDRKGGGAWTRFALPTWWHYDALRGLEYLRRTSVTPLERAAEAIELIASASSIMRAKREDAAIRQAVARSALSDFAVRVDPRAYHLWLALPKPGRSHQFVTAAARRGIAPSSASMLAIREAHAANAVRIALPWPPLPELRRAMDILAQLLRSTPGNVE